MICYISKEYDNCTVKQYLLGELNLSGKMLTRLKSRSDGIMLNGVRVTVRAILHDGDSLSLNVEQEDKTSDNIKPVNMPLEIIFEDEYYIALNKPANTPTHTSHDHYEDTLANGLANLYRERNLPFVFRAVNRLDRDTSGIVVFAKSSSAANEFSKLQQNKLVTKKYIALVEGVVRDNFSIKGYIRRKPGSVMLREFSHTEQQGASYSHTDCNPLAFSGEYSLVELVLHTGRTHQIRLHLSEVGHPVAGDGLYGNEGRYTRHMLHAYSMSFCHPFTKKQIYLTADLPFDMRGAIIEKGIIHDIVR